MIRNRSILILAVLIMSCGGPDVDFNADIRPILNDRCVLCHGGVKAHAQLNLKFRDRALLGGESGLPAVVPGDASASELIKKVSHADPSDRMPKDEAPLSEGEIQKLRKWIDQGAKWEPHWAYVAPVKPAASLDDKWIRSPIDAFVLERLRTEGLEPADEAECAVLARRVSLDLIGLPTTADRASEMCASGNYEDLVDELLASPSFGERWTALWLDLARYADSRGYEADAGRSIWRYRDWLIQAFNEDMPFDQFTIEQLAGDLLDEPSSSQLIATAFSRNTMTNTEGGTDDEEHRVAAVIDRVNTTWEVFQGTTMKCVQCHGHPYDPFVHSDYYASFALFNETADWDQGNEEPVLREFELAHQDRGEALLGDRAKLEIEISEFVSTEEMLEIRAEWESSLDDPLVASAINSTALHEVIRIVSIPHDERTAHQNAFMRDRFAEAHESTAELREERSNISAAMDSLSPTVTPVMRRLPEGELRTTRRFERGSFLAPLELVEPGVPASLPAMTDSVRADRLAFARWLVSPENPLTARVTVNRFWEQLFGLGIVESTGDFGTVGIRPTHPQLLDWLAVHFQDDLSWSVKRILREIVLSSTYRQASNISDDKRNIDPENRLLSRGPRFRLNAEQIRDQALAVSGLLSAKQLGPSVMPPQPDGIWKNPYSGLYWEAAEDEERYRRALYTYWRRTGPYPSMEAFGVPSREVCLSRRILTNTPLQALVTLNDPGFWEAAEALAVRMEDELPEAASKREQVALGYRLALAREPSKEKLDVLTELAEDASMALVANVILNLDEFLTKE